MSEREQEKRDNQLAAFMREFEKDVVPHFFWFFTSYGELRGWAPWFDDEVCPLKAFGVMSAEWDRDAHSVAERCGLEAVSYEIVEAADSWFASQLRIELEQAVGYFRGKGK